MSLKTIQNTRKYRRTKKGVITNIYSKQLERCRLKGFPAPQYSLEGLRSWCFEKMYFHQLYDDWVKSDYNRWMKPSIDRIDCLKPYFFDNIQLMTAGENKRKGDAEKEILWGKKLIQMSLDYEILTIFPSVKRAEKVTGINRHNISKSCHNNSTAGGFRWKYYSKGKWKRIYKNPELLK